MNIPQYIQESVGVCTNSNQGRHISVHVSALHKTYNKGAIGPHGF